MNFVCVLFCCYLSFSVYVLVTHVVPTVLRYDCFFSLFSFFLCFFQQHFSLVLDFSGLCFTIRVSQVFVTWSIWVSSLASQSSFPSLCFSSFLSWLLFLVFCFSVLVVLSAHLPSSCPSVLGSCYLALDFSFQSMFFEFPSSIVV